MVTIIHGEDIVASQKLKIELLKKGLEVIELESPEISILKQATESKSLFSEEKIVILSGKFDKLFDKLIEIINSSEIPIYIFSEKTLSNKTISQFPKAKIILNKPKAIIFEFLESIRPKTAKNTISLYKNLNNEPELIFFMITRQFRNLILVKDGTWTSEINPWQKSKLASQAQYFTLEGLLKIYKDLEKIDYENKTGQSPLELSKTLELFLLKI